MDDSFEDTEWDMFVGGLLRFHNVCLEFSSSLLNLCCTTKFPHLINLDKYLLLKNRKYTKFFQCWHFTRLHICVNFPLSQALNYELKTPRWAHANLKWVDPVHNQLTFRGKYIYVSSGGLGALEAWRTTASRRWEDFCSSFRLFFGVFFIKMVKRRLHFEVRIRSSPPYPRSGGASCAGGGRVESCARRISWDPVGFRVRWCDFKSVSSDLRFSSLAMVAALVRWSFGALARRLPICLLQQALLRQALPGSDDGGLRMAARLWLALVSVFIARWSSDLIVIFITFRTLRTAIDNY
jgi:hypothetical protein